MRYDLFRAFQEIAWPFGARIFGFWRGFGEGACPQRPDCFARSARHYWAPDSQGLGSQTEPKRSQNPKRPLLYSFLPNGYSISDNALTRNAPISIFAKNSYAKMFHVEHFHSHSVKPTVDSPVNL